MSDDLEQRLWDQVNEAQQKYAYFKVAAALSAIAFTVHTTQGDKLGWQHAPFDVAALAWAISAYCGFKAISNALGILDDRQFLKLQNEARELLGERPALFAD